MKNETETENETQNPKFMFNRKMTCLVVHDIGHFKHLVTKKGVKLINEIINFSNSIFDNVDPLHLRIVQNSSLNGMFCPYIECNKLMRRMKNLPVISDPLKSHKDWFTQDRLEKSITTCSIGPVDKILPELPDVFSDSDSEDDEIDLEMAFYFY